MSDNVQRRIIRRIAAVLASGGVAFVLGWITARLGGIPLPTVQGSAAGLFGLLFGWVGMSANSLRRANLAGLFIGGLSVLPLLLFNFTEPSMTIGGFVWIVAAQCSLGSICAQVGAVIGGPATTSDKSPRTMQFTLKQLSAFFIPVAVYFGYVSVLMRK